MLTLRQTNAFVTALKDRAKADEIAASINDDDHFAKVVERKDGRFVVVVVDRETGEEMPL